MCGNGEGYLNIHISNHYQDTETRYLNPDDIILPAGYKIEVYVSGLDAPTSMTFTRDGDLYVAESGMVSGKGRVVRIRNGMPEVIAEDFYAPITGLNHLRNDIYVSHKCHISVIRTDRSVEKIMEGLPGNGDYGGSNVAFGNDGKMYWAQGTNTNSGVVGTDNTWVNVHPFLCDYPGSYMILNGQNFEAPNILANPTETVSTGAFSPFGSINRQFEVRKGVTKASGSILRANLDGSELEMVVWGLRYPSHIAFDYNYRLFAANQGFDDRGSRPVTNAPDEFQMIIQGEWYGWPDYAGGEPVTSPRFQPEGGVQPEFLLTNHPDTPVRPYVLFPPYSGIMGFDFNYNRNFGPYGDVFIAEAGGKSVSTDGDITPFSGYGHRISRIDMSTRGVTTFAINRSGFPASLTGEGGFGSPVDALFGPDGALYILDFGVNMRSQDRLYKANSGVIWRIVRLSQVS